MVTAAHNDIETLLALSDEAHARASRVDGASAAGASRLRGVEAGPLSAQDVDDRAEVRAAQAGDDDAFARLCEDARPRLIRHLQSRGDNTDDAEEIAQESLARAWRALAGFDGRSRFYTWLYGIARHVRLDLRRSRRRRPDSAPTAPRVDEEIHVAAREESPIASLITEERRAQLARALEALPERQRQALVMRFLDERGCDEIGDELGTTANGASMLIFRAKSELSLSLPADWFGRRVA